MDVVIEWLKEARGEITAGLVLALLGWIFSRYRAFMKMYRLKKQELERVKNELAGLGATKQEFERLQEALKESESQLQDMRSQLEQAKRELQRKHDELSQSESQRQKDIQTIAELRRQLEVKQQEKEKQAPTPKRPAISDAVFLELCTSGNALKVEEAINNGANVNARRDNGFTALILATISYKTETVRVLLDYGAYFNAKNNGGITALFWATNYGRTEIAQLLRQYGAN